jgi:hypothetical protein
LLPILLHRVLKSAPLAFIVWGPMSSVLVRARGAPLVQLC